jgi:broad specificity phosphatase PhoE
MKKYCTLYLVRHGQTDWNVNGLIQGHEDTPLNKKGESQAFQLATKLKKIHFDAIFSSDLLRAKRSAEIIAKERKMIITTSIALRERYFGKFQGQKFGKEKNIKKLIDNLMKNSKTEKDKVETDDLITARLVSYLGNVSISNLGKTVLVVTHAAPIRTFLINLGFGTYDNLPNGCIANLAYLKLKSDGKDFFIAETSGISKIK